MKKKLVLKPFVLPTIYMIMLISLLFVGTNIMYSEEPSPEITYVSNTSLNNDVIPTLQTEEEDEIVINPYTGENVTIISNFYNYEENNENQENSIIKYGDTYIQNSGITYTQSEPFNIVSIMDGEVTKVYSSDLLGNIVEITHDNEIISIYQMLDTPNVKEKDKVVKGEVIGKSGKSKLREEGYNLQFEILKEGVSINPQTILGKKIKEL